MEHRNNSTTIASQEGCRHCRVKCSVPAWQPSLLACRSVWMDGDSGGLGSGMGHEQLVLQNSAAAARARVKFFSLRYSLRDIGRQGRSVNSKKEVVMRRWPNNFMQSTPFWVVLFFWRRCPACRTQFSHQALRFLCYLLLIILCASVSPWFKFPPHVYRFTVLIEDQHRLKRLSSNNGYETCKPGPRSAVW
jgi:hypothetical protein